MDDYLTEALFGIQNDFDHISCNISYGQTRIPDMINIIGRNAFERDSETLKDANSEIRKLFLSEKKQLFFQQSKRNEDISKNMHALEFPNSFEENNNNNNFNYQYENTMSQESKNIQNNRFQLDDRLNEKSSSINQPIEFSLIDLFDVHNCRKPFQ